MEADYGEQLGRGQLGADVVALFANGYVQVLRNNGGFKLVGEVDCHGVFGQWALLK
jgi:hypothetical protein